MEHSEDIITIIKDFEELERLGLKFTFKGINDYDVDMKDLVNDGFEKKLNSYMGIVKRLEYYDDESVFNAWKIKAEIGGKL